MFISPAELQSNRYDVIVAGSGPAGAFVAKKVAALGKKVLVLETGGAEFDGIVQDSYAQVHGRGHFDSSYWPSHWIRALGGTSAVWAGWLTPLTERNFESWPISRSELDPWYDYAAMELGRDPIISHWEANSLPGFKIRPVSSEDPIRLGDADGEPIWNHERVHILLNATLARLFPRQDRRKIERARIHIEPDFAVDFDLQDHQSLVLAAGGMGNAQILLASGDENGAAVGNENDQLGRYLFEHPHIYDCAKIVANGSLNFAAPPKKFGAHELLLVPEIDEFNRAGHLDASIELKSSEGDEEDAIEFFVSKRLAGEVRYFDLTVRSEMRAIPENRVEKTHGLDPAGLPRLRATCIFGGDDYRVVFNYLDRLGAALASKNLGRLKVFSKDVMYATGGGHIMGTTRMGANPKTSVTDSNCRVHGYSNLFIAGSSLFPSGGYANPTMTIVSLSLRLGEYLEKNN